MSGVAATARRRRASRPSTFKANGGVDTRTVERVEGSRTTLRLTRRRASRCRSSRSPKRVLAAELQHSARSAGRCPRAVDEVVGREAPWTRPQILSARGTSRASKRSSRRLVPTTRIGSARLCGAETDWASLDDALEWAADLRALVDSEIDERRRRASSLGADSSHEARRAAVELGRRHETRSAATSRQGKREELQQDFMTTVEDARELLGAPTRNARRISRSGSSTPTRGRD